MTYLSLMSTNPSQRFGISRKFDFADDILELRVKSRCLKHILEHPTIYLKNKPPIPSEFYLDKKGIISISDFGNFL